MHEKSYKCTVLLVLSNVRRERKRYMVNVTKADSYLDSQYLRPFFQQVCDPVGLRHVFG